MIDAPAADDLYNPFSAHSFIKWAGSKRVLVPELLKRAPERFGHYHEPFVGGGALFWALASAGRLKSHVSLSDTCEPLVRTWRAIRDDVQAVIRELVTYPITSEWYYKMRAIDPARLSDANAAAWFLFMNKTCFNGVWRVNRSGRMNVPWGKWDEYGRLPSFDLSNLHACSRVLSALRALVTVRPFETILAHAQPGDFVYFDPPYLPTSATADFTAYTAGGFTREDHVRLRDVARELKDRGVHVMLSNSDVPLVRELYQAWPEFQIDVVEAPRAVNSKGTGRGKVRELIIR